MSLYTDTYDAVVADVISITNRPDLVAETEIAVRAATLSCHSFGMYPRDLNTQLIKITEPAYIQSLDTTTLMPRIRGLSSVFLSDINDDPMTYPEIEVTDINDIRDPEYRTMKNNIAYLAGTVVHIRSEVQTYGYLVSYYQYPSTVRASYNSWIAQTAKDIIVMYAAHLVLRANGNQEKANSLFKFVMEILKPQLDSNFLTTINR